MIYLQNFITTTIQLNIYLILVIGLLYVIIHYYRNKGVNAFLDIYLNYIPVLTHEFGHVLFNKLAGGKAKDLVIVTSPRERKVTSQQGYAITQSKGYLGQFITTIGGYLMPPLMFLTGLVSIHYQYPSTFITIYLFIFIYYFFITSRKLSPLIVIILISSLLYLVFKQDHQWFIYDIVTLSYHFILGVLLGEILQSSWTIFRLTFQRPKPSWDGSALTKVTRVPTFIFSLVWILFNLYTVYLLIKYTIL
ncbi:M50 family metallopeptidase [Staphylococcus epidermidis]|uniref:M50 family metallopeptidase n=1 Tax=Staphylococcus epidermidis TaxID=1282 RepID=UPI001FBBEAC4|nr:M50 family metallopeptidase [Staphylococcus epidermidis]UOH67845.1 M50 family metallopeptidase [Staphylococcus epidermidis]UOH70107.1 M50 family metallopeptidase [Staphylococcus epidermidis]UOH72372.1 M50 family metallopeptidase [Staphylococcus epidermidis]